jgi:Zn finger protein HypA/HybF involved in hydrogenase expression
MKCKECGDDFVAIPTVFKYCPKCCKKLRLIDENGKWIGKK